MTTLFFVGSQIPGRRLLPADVATGNHRHHHLLTKCWPGSTNCIQVDNHRIWSVQIMRSLISCLIFSCIVNDVQFSDESSGSHSGNFISQKEEDTGAPQAEFLAGKCYYLLNQKNWWNTHIL